MRWMRLIQLPREETDGGGKRTARGQCVIWVDGEGDETHLVALVGRDDANRDGDPEMTMEAVRGLSD